MGTVSLYLYNDVSPSRVTLFLLTNSASTRKRLRHGLILWPSQQVLSFILHVITTTWVLSIQHLQEMHTIITSRIQVLKKTTGEEYCLRKSLLFSTSKHLRSTMFFVRKKTIWFWKLHAKVTYIDMTLHTSYFMQITKIRSSSLKKICLL